MRPANKHSTIRTSAEWAAYFEANARIRQAIPWHEGAGVTEEELCQIAASLRAWQLGETSDGSHLLAAARSYARKVHDLDFVEAVRGFIREEQGHGADLGRFLDLAGVPRAKADWGDALFRAARYSLPSMEAWATPVVMVETHALVYYDAVRRATGSRVLRSICQQILRDEIPHIQFQCERLAILHRNRSRSMLLLTQVLHRLFFSGITIAIWAGHRRVLKAGGHNFTSFWRTAWKKMNLAWKKMDSRAFAWEGEDTACHADYAPETHGASSASS